jgi:hypothetical protein
MLALALGMLAALPHPLSYALCSSRHTGALLCIAGKLPFHRYPPAQVQLIIYESLQATPPRARTWGSPTQCSLT